MLIAIKVVDEIVTERAVFEKEEDVFEGWIINSDFPIDSAYSEEVQEDE